MKLIKSLGILLILFILPLVSGSFGDEWGEYQNSPDNLGHTGLLITDLSGNWNETDFVSSITDGADFQPLGLDVDNDNIVEIIGSDGNYLKIWSYDASLGLHLEQEKDMSNTQTVGMSAISNFDIDSYVEFIAKQLILENEFTCQDNNLSDGCSGELEGLPIGFFEIKAYAYDAEEALLEEYLIISQMFIALI